MNQQWTPVQEINKLLALLTEVNDVLAKLSPDSHKLQRIQYERIKEQYVQQVAEQLSRIPQRLIVQKKASL